MLIIMRALLILFSSVIGYLIAGQIYTTPVFSRHPIFYLHPLIANNFEYIGLASGFIIAVLAIVLEELAKKTPVRIIAGSAFGLIIGLMVSNLITYPLVLNVLKDPYLELMAYLMVNGVIGYVGFNIGMNKGDEFESFFKGHLLQGISAIGKNKDRAVKILDTSVIIDGRIADICETGFIEGTIVIPQFILRELQYIADSPDPIKRARGKRGLDVLQRIQKQIKCEVTITDHDFPKIREVDAKLVELAKALSATIVTNDSNLNKVAELQGVSVFSINQLAAAIRPAVLPGEVMNILVLKEGREQGQGVGYLDDGTMVVIDNAKRLMGRNVDVAVTSILQTTSGRMIFSKLKEEIKPELYYQTSN